MTKGETVFYDAHGTTVRARVVTKHRDGSVSVAALFFLDADGKDCPGYIGEIFRMSADELRSVA